MEYILYENDFPKMFPFLFSIFDWKGKLYGTKFWNECHFLGTMCSQIGLYNKFSIATMESEMQEELEI